MTELLSNIATQSDEFIIACIESHTPYRVYLPTPRCGWWEITGYNYEVVCQARTLSELFQQFKRLIDDAAR